MLPAAGAAQDLGFAQELLVLLQRHLDPFALGDVLGNAGDSVNLPGCIFHRKSAVTDPPYRPVRSHDAIFHLKSLLPLPLKDADHALAILAVYRVHE